MLKRSLLVFSFAVSACFGAVAADTVTLKACASLTPQDLTSIALQLDSKLMFEVVDNYTTKSTPGLPSAMRVEECNSFARAGGSQPVRISLYLAERELTAPEWLSADKTILEILARSKSSSLQSFGELRCASEGVPGSVLTPRAIKQKIFSAYCEVAKGKYLFNLLVEHEDASKLPALSKLAAVTKQAAVQLTVLKADKK